MDSTLELHQLPKSHSQYSLNDHFTTHVSPDSFYNKNDSSTPEQYFNTPNQVSKLLHQNAMKKIHYPAWLTVFNGIMAGIFVSFGGFLALSVGGGFSLSVQANHPAIGKLSIGSLFGVALFLILIFGGELFTGNTMVMMLALYDKKIKISQAAKNLGLVFIGNFVGCVLSGFLFGYVTDIYGADPYLSFLRSVTEHKVHQNFHVILLKGIPANALVCLAVAMSNSSRDMAGKAILIWFPVLAFAAVGFEHCVANMFFIPMGMFYQADISAGGFTLNLLGAAIGNIIGGGLVVAGAQSIMHSHH